MNKARQYVLYLLKFRPRSEYELHQRLKRKGFPETVIGETLSFLKEKGLIDDRAFTRMWVEERIKKPLGFKRIRQELVIKGINEELIGQVLDTLGQRYSEEKVIKDLVSRRWERLRHIEPPKAKRRLFLYLLRRGFSSDRIQEAIDQI